MPDHETLTLEAVFQRSIAIVAAVSAAYVTFSSAIISLEVFFIPQDLQNGILWASRLTWITACLLLMYFFTPRFQSRSHRKSIILGTVLVITAAFGLLVSSVIQNRYILTYDINQFDPKFGTYKLMRPIKIDPVIADLVGTKIDASLDDQNDALERNLAYGDSRASEIASELASNNHWTAFIYWLSTYIGITMSFIGLLIIAWTVSVVRR